MAWNTILNGALNSSDIKDPGYGSVYDLLAVVANIAIIVGVGLGTISLAYAFFSVITAQGDPKAMDKARNAVVWAVIAIFASALAFLIKNIFFGLIGVNVATPATP